VKHFSLPCRCKEWTVESGAVKVGPIDGILAAIKALVSNAVHPQGAECNAWHTGNPAKERQAIFFPSRANILAAGAELAVPAGGGNWFRGKVGLPYNPALIATAYGSQ